MAWQAAAMHRGSLLSGLVCLTALLAACNAPAEAPARLSGLLVNPPLAEVSGLAASRAHPGVLWLHNDGGNTPYLYAVSRRGRLLARMRVLGVPNTDWEDLAAFQLRGTSYLLLADTGDNGGLRRTLQLHVIAEPRSLAQTSLQPAWSIVFRWPDGPRDCEAVAVDAAAGEVLLVSKKRVPAELFSVPLRPRGEGVVRARALGRLAGLSGPGSGAGALAQAPLEAQVTAADIAPDGRQLAVLTYGQLLVYPRRGRESWAQAVGRAPQRRGFSWLPQAEALGWSADGDGVYVTGEITPAPLLWLRTQD